MRLSFWKTYGPHKGGPVRIKTGSTPRGHSLRCTVTQLLGGRRWSLALITGFVETPEPDTSPADPVDPFVFAKTVRRAAEMRRSDKDKGSLPWDRLTDAQKVPYIVRTYAIETKRSADT